MQLTQWWGFLLSSPILPTAKELSWINHPISCYPHIWYLLLPLIQTAAPSWDSSSSRRCRQRSLCFCVCPVSSASQHYSKWGRTWPLFSLLQQAALQKLTKSISKAWRADPWLQRAQSMYSSAHWRLAGLGGRSLKWLLVSPPVEPRELCSCCEERVYFRETPPPHFYLYLYVFSQSIWAAFSFQTHLVGRYNHFHIRQLMCFIPPCSND